LSSSTAKRRILPWLDYISAGPQGAMKIISDQKRWQNNPDGQKIVAYDPILHGLRRAASLPDPRAELEQVITKAEGWGTWQASAYQEIVDGFLSWWRPEFHGVPVGKKVTWVAASGLVVDFVHLIGVRAGDRSAVVLPYVKGPKLDQSTADLMLALVHEKVGELLPDATPIALDTRRGKQFRLSPGADHTALMAYQQGQAAAYVAQWAAAA
jgi:hypothetical protein